jgi:pleiotropic regulator 1
VGAIVSQRNNPQVITGSFDSSVKLWDLAAGKCMNTLTYHKKAWAYTGPLLSST